MDKNKLLTQYIDELEDKRFMRLSKYFEDITIKELRDDNHHCFAKQVRIWNLYWAKHNFLMNCVEPVDRALMKIFLNNHYKILRSDSDS